MHELTVNTSAIEEFQATRVRDEYDPNGVVARAEPGQAAVYGLV
jgi:hypothetical protein